ncbi:hypothetical protein ACQKPE_22375 [Pseudomonas sp. NPDC089554]|uniref:hypothetical protein n=1 Tax=Pseudomonas sp. NPDC089554 TaxID=3390653 RepID=UPI003D03FE43
MSNDILGPARHVIGSRYVESVKAYILDLTGLSIAVGPEDPTNCEPEFETFMKERVRIDTDDNGNICSMHVG